ncbi:oligosaccharide flippase family protein [Virgibacillus dakarensis]|nr:oligosaccharide flippase family protein [Virgibacillus dakarensis]
MKKLTYKLTRSQFVRNVAVMATGAAGAQAVTMALSPIITRLYGPEAFGMMGTFTALTNIIIPIAALTYPIAIVLPKKDRDAKGIIKLSLYIAFLIAILTTIVILFFNSTIISLFNIEEIAPYLYLIPLVIIFAGLMQVSEQWLIRTNQFAINAKVNFLQSVIINGSKVGIGFIYPVATVLVILQTAANGLRAIMMIFFAKRSKGGVTKSQDKGVSIKKLAKKHIDFPIYRAPQVFVGAFSDSLPVLLLTTFFGPASAGFYNIGRTVLSLPSKLIGQSIGDVFYPRISEAANNGENVSRLIKKASLALTGMGIIPFGIVIIFGPWLFEFVFGQEWVVAGEYARWIALTSFAVFINKPAVRSMPVLSAQGIHLIYTIVILVTRVLALLTGFFVFNSDVVAIALFGISSTLLNACLFLITLNLGKKLYKKVG